MEHCGGANEVVHQAITVGMTFVTLERPTHLTLIRSHTKLKSPNKP